MASKWLLGVLSIIVAGAVVGVGYAAYTSTATATVTVNAASFYITGSGVLTASSLAVGSCTSSASGNSITLTGSSLLPGDYCNWTVTYTDSGSLPGTYVTYHSGSNNLEGTGCSQITVNAQFISFFSPTVSPGGTAGSFWWNDTDTGNGVVSGPCSGTDSVTYLAS